MTPAGNHACARGSVAGHGIDVVDLKTFAVVLGPAAAPHIERTFTKRELDEADLSGRRLEKLAGKFAVKESIMKALGTGFGDGVAFTDIEVCSSPAGAPTVTLHRGLLEIANAKRIETWLVSVSHTDSSALASVICLT